MLSKKIGDPSFNPAVSQGAGHGNQEALNKLRQIHRQLAETDRALESLYYKVESRAAEIAELRGALTDMKDRLAEAKSGRPQLMTVAQLRLMLLARTPSTQSPEAGASIEPEEPTLSVEQLRRIGKIVSAIPRRNGINAIPSVINFFKYHLDEDPVFTHHLNEDTDEWTVTVTVMDEELGKATDPKKKAARRQASQQVVDLLNDHKEKVTEMVKKKDARLKIGKNGLFGLTDGYGLSSESRPSQGADTIERPEDRGPGFN